MARTTTGRGQKVETSLLQATLSFLGENAATFFEDGNVPSRQSRCRRAQVFTFTACDGLPFAVHLSSPEKFWRGMLAAINRETLAADERFRTRELRVKNYDALYAELAATFQSRPRAEWLALLGEHDVPSGPVNTLDEVFADPQVVALDIARICRIAAAARSRSWAIQCGSVQHRRGWRPLHRTLAHTTMRSCADMT